MTEKSYHRMIARSWHEQAVLDELHAYDSAVINTLIDDISAAILRSACQSPEITRLESYRPHGT